VSVAKVSVLDAKGKKTGEVELVPSVFAIEPNMPVMHQVVRALRASWRQGTHDTKTRGEVQGGGAKPWRQKGTGRARAGSIRSPLWKGGGVVFGPHPRDYSFPVPRKVRRLALLSALSSKAGEDRIIVIADPAMDKPSTKQMAAMLAAAGVDAKATLVVARGDDSTAKSVRNLAHMRVIDVTQVNTYDVLDNHYLVFTESALKWLTEVYAS
jgi:large subunit ribosomal protein L4